MSSRHRPSEALFFDGLRTVEGRLPAGLVRLGPPATAGALAAAEQRLGRSLPLAYAEFLRSFDGADLFHEGLLVCGVGDDAQRNLVESNVAGAPPGGHAEELVIGESATGDLFMLELEAPETHDEPRVFRVRPDADERWLAGSSFPRWLEAVIAHEALLYDADGEFLPDAFEPDGEELTPTFALRQAERALRKDPGSALYLHDKGLALRRMGKLPQAREAFGQSAAADPSNPWPWFDLGRCDHELGRHGEAAAAFECAAEAAQGPEGARFSAWAARSFHRAGERATAERLRGVALDRAPDLVATLNAAATAAQEAEDDATAADISDLATLIANPVPLSRKLPLLSPPPAPITQAGGGARASARPGHHGARGAQRPPKGAKGAGKAATKSGTSRTSHLSRSARPPAKKTSKKPRR